MNGTVKILCVDDEQNVLNALRRLFLDEEYEIHTANSGDDGLRVQERENAQIIISDYRMPSMNGVEFLQEVNKRWPDTVRIVLSGYADTAAIVDAINEGQIYKFIAKPWNDNELKVAIANAIERYHLFKKNLELTLELQQKNSDLEKLLSERTAILEQRSLMLANFQHIIDAIPVGVLGIDNNGMLVQANKEWFRVLRGDFSALGQNLDTFMTPDIVALAERAKRESRVFIRTAIQGVAGRMIGSLLRGAGGQEGIILVFIPDDERI